MYLSLLNFFSENAALKNHWYLLVPYLREQTPGRVLNSPKRGAYLSNYRNLQLKSLLHVGLYYIRVVYYI